MGETHTFAMNRRSFLAAAGLGLSVPLVGCVQAPGSRQNDGPAGSSETDDAAGSSETDGPTTEDERRHDLVVENYTETTLMAEIRVLETDTAIVDGRYELPDGRGIEFEDLAIWEHTYTIELSIEGGDPTAFSWQTKDCGAPEESPGSGGSRDATIRIEADSEAQGDHQLSLLVDECDAIYGPQLPTGPANGFRLED